MTFKAKACKACGRLFDPASGRQAWCKACRPGKGKGGQGTLVEQIRAIRAQLEDAMERLDDVEGKAGVLWDERRERVMARAGKGGTPARRTKKGAPCMPPIEKLGTAEGNGDGE